MNYEEKLNKIQQVLEENLDLTWIDRLVYNPFNKTYHTANDLDFNDNRKTWAYLINDKKIGHLAKVTLNDTKFIIEINGLKMDASEHWKELIDEQFLFVMRNNI